MMACTGLPPALARAWLRSSDPQSQGSLWPSPSDSRRTLRYVALLIPSLTSAHIHTLFLGVRAGVCWCWCVHCNRWQSLVCGRTVLRAALDDAPGARAKMELVAVSGRHLHPAERLYEGLHAVHQGVPTVLAKDHVAQQGRCGIRTLHQGTYREHMLASTHSARFAFKNEREKSERE